MDFTDLRILFAPTLPVIIGLTAFAIVMAVINRTTRLGVIATGTVREIVRQPIFLLVTIVAAAFLLLNLVIPFFAFEDETKMYIDCSLSTILLAGLFITIWSAASSVNEEVEAKTAMTLLSKPIMRWQFILGKYLGIAQSAMWLVVVETLIFLPATYFKYGYDQKETGKGKMELFEWTNFGVFDSQLLFFHPDRLEAAISVIPGISLVFMQIIVIGAVSVMLSTRLPLLVNVITCVAIYMVGHLTPQLVASGGDRLVFVQFIGQVLASILPALEGFDTSAAVATGKDIPAAYIGTTAIYSLCYITISMLLSFILFEDHDLA